MATARGGNAQRARQPGRPMTDLSGHPLLTIGFPGGQEPSRLRRRRPGMARRRGRRPETLHSWLTLLPLPLLPFPVLPPLARYPADESPVQRVQCVRHHQKGDAAGEPLAMMASPAAQTQLGTEWHRQLRWAPRFARFFIMSARRVVMRHERDSRIHLRRDGGRGSRPRQGEASAFQAHPKLVVPLLLIGFLACVLFLGPLQAALAQNVEDGGLVGHHHNRHGRRSKL